MPWTQKQMLRDANGDLIPQYWDVVEQEFKPLTGRDGASDVRLTGRNVEKIIMADSVAITTAGTHTFTGDFTKYKKVLFFVRDTHDVKGQLSIRFQVHGSPFGVVYENDERRTLNRVMELHSADVFLNTKFPFLSELALPDLRFDVSYDEAPTSGSLSITAFGVIN